MLWFKRQKRNLKMSLIEWVYAIFADFIVILPFIYIFRTCLWNFSLERLRLCAENGYISIFFMFVWLIYITTGPNVLFW